MTKEEIKQLYSMRDILEQYEIFPNENDFVNCPFCEDGKVSMKINEDDYYCSTCNANGDIFTFIQNMEKLTFPEAFKRLGGTYGKPTFESKLILYRAKKNKETKLNQQEKMKSEIELIFLLINVYLKWIHKLEPFTGPWEDCYIELKHQFGKLENSNARW